MDNTVFDITIIGGGCVGLSAAYKINLHYPQLKILVLEKENKLAAHQTGRNSGVIHSGLYYKPGSYKAKNCVEGRRELVQFAREYNIPHEVCGKVIAAVTVEELPQLNKVFDNGIQNGVEGVEKINADQIRQIEPFCTGIAGIHVPCTGIIDFEALTNKLAELSEAKFTGSKVLLNHEVISFQKNGDYVMVHTSRGKYRSKKIVNCAGLYSDRIARKDGVQAPMQIVGFRGDYYDLTEKALHKVRNLIYPVPDPRFPFLGVHFTRMIRGGVECGPNAVFTFKREGYGKTDFDFRDTAQALGYKGTWNLLFRHWRFALDEYSRAFSKRLFLARLRKLIPSLQMDDITPGRAGVRAMALAPDGNMIDDFKIEFRGNSLHVLNAPSPAATACLAIGDAIREMAEKYFQLAKV